VATYTAPLPPTRAPGDPDPAGDTNKLTTAVSELRGVVDAVEASAGGGADPEAEFSELSGSLVAGTNVSLAVDAEARTVTVSATPGSAPDATASTKGSVQLAGDLAGTAAAPTVPGKVTRIQTKKVHSGTSYTLVAGDATDTVLHFTTATAVTVTLPQDSAATISQEVPIAWRQYGAGQLTFVAGTGATLLSRGGATKSAGQYAEGVITKVTANTWLLSGDITS
jgi:hypothetical protein